MATLRQAAARGARYATYGCVVSLVLLAAAGCDLNTPTSPNDPGSLDGQNPNESFAFTGTIGLGVEATTLSADDLSQVIITAQVLDAQGRPVPNLTPVVFTTTLGTFVPGQSVRSSIAHTFNGLASVVLSSFERATGTATVRAIIGNVAASVNIQLEPAPVNGLLSLTVGGGTFVTGPASEVNPFIAALVAEAVNLDGEALAGVPVRFEIVEDDSTGSGVGPARFIGQATSFTNAQGEANNQIEIKGVGRVLVEAVLFDPNTGEAVARSNQVIILTVDRVIVSVTATPSSGAAPFASTITATVTDEAGNPLSGKTVRFSITEDSTTSGGTFAGPTVGQTDGSGVFSTTLNVPDAGSVTVQAQVDAEVNQVTVTGT